MHTRIMDPHVNDIVRFQTVSVNEHGLGVHIKLVDYDNRPAFILRADYSKSKTIPKLDNNLVQWGRVLRVGYGFVDVLRRGVVQHI